MSSTTPRAASVTHWTTPETAPFLVDSSNGITTNVSNSFNTFNQLTRSVQITPTSVTTDFAYDANGNLLSETTGTQVKQYTWDLDNRLKQITLPSLLTNTFAYDANGLRIQKVDSTGTTKYLLDGPSVLEELNSGGGVVTSYVTHPQQIDDIISFQQGGATYYPLADALGSIYAITDVAGAVVTRNSYDVYGARTSSGSGPQIAFGYAGREFNSDTGHVYYRQRYRDPINGGWIQPDTVQPFVSRHLDIPNELNAYAYVHARPTQLTDPSGDSPLLLLIALLVIIALYMPNDDVGLIEPGATLFGIVAGEAIGGEIVAAACTRFGSIRVTTAGLTHVIERHTWNGVPRWIGKSKFHASENVLELILSAAGKPYVRQNGRLSANRRCWPRNWDRSNDSCRNSNTYRGNRGRQHTCDGFSWYPLI